jgi:hypothetical protein
VPQYKQLDVFHVQAAAATYQRTEQGPKSEVEEGEGAADLPRPSPEEKVTRILAPLRRLRTSAPSRARRAR